MDTRSELTIGQVEARNVERLCSLTIETEPSKRTAWELRLARTWGAGQHDAWEVGQPVCRGCGAKIDPTPICAVVAEQPVQFPITVCDACMALARAHYSPIEQTRSVSLTPQWDEKCPPRFQHAVASLPANVDSLAFKRVCGWRPSHGKGLALKGPSGAGKTTAFWALARELEREGTKPVCLSGVEFGRELSKAARDVEAVEWLCGCRVLMIDDFGKERATPAVGALLWEVLDRRYSHALPLIVTTRFDGKELRERFGEPYLGDDILRRLNELCTGVLFKLPEQNAAA